MWVQTPDERADRIDSAVQRKLVDNIQMAQTLGAEVVKLQGDDVAAAIVRFARERGVTLALVGQSRRSWWHRVRNGSVVTQLIDNTEGLDVLVVSLDEPTGGERLTSADESCA